MVPLVIITTPIVILLLYSSNNPPPLHKGQQGLDTFKINGNGGSKKLCKKRGASQFRNGRFPYLIKIFLEVLYDAT